MSTNKFLLITVSVFIIVTLTSCSLTGAPGGGSQPSQEPTSFFETQVAEAVASTFTAQTAIVDALVSTQAALATPTAQFTFTPSFTPSAAFTSTPSVPMVSVSIPTNCRSGPTTAYDLLGVLNVGESAEVVGRSTYTDTMVIRLPSRPSITCWLWAQHATVAGNTAGLPLINVPPTPTLAPTAQGSFNVIYSSTITCSGKFEA